MKVVNEYHASLNKDKKVEVMNTIQYLAYFSLKSNLALEQYPHLLASEQVGKIMSKYIN